MNAYRIETGLKADAQLARLDAAIGTSVERKILWLSQNAAGMVHRRLVGMPDELSGLCKLRVGDYRVLFILEKDLLFVHQVKDRTDAYRD